MSIAIRLSLLWGGLVIISGHRFNVTFTPRSLDRMVVGETGMIQLNYTCVATTPKITMRVDSEDSRIVRVSNRGPVVICPRPEGMDEAPNVTVEARFIGKLNLLFRFTENSVTETETTREYRVIVARIRTTLMKVFIGVTATLMVILNIGFGCSIDLDVIKEIMRKPIAPVIGALCQFILMPLLGFATSNALRMENVFGFGVLVCACAPGGGGSNVWTLLLGGDLDLSLAMTFFSKLLALVMVPFWMWALGGFYVHDTDIEIPYGFIAGGMLTIALPCSFGAVIRHWRPRLGQRVCHAIKPLAAVFLLWVIVVGSVTNTFIYRVMGRVWYVIPAAMFLPYFGFLLGYVIARVCRQSVRRAATIAIETGIQDTGIGILLLLATFPKPDGDLATTMPIAVALVTPLPLATALAAMKIHQRWSAKYSLAVSDVRQDSCNETGHDVTSAKMEVAYGTTQSNGVELSGMRAPQDSRNATVQH